MEAHAAVRLTIKNAFFIECKVEVGAYIADNDSCSDCAIQNARDHEIVEHADKNHTSKGVVNQL